MKKRHSLISKKMLSFFLLTFLLTGIISKTIAGNVSDKRTGNPSIEGRWDLTIYADGREEPSWLEVLHSGTHHLVGSFVGSGGSARPISKINFSNGNISFTIPPQWEQEDNDLSFEATFQGDSLKGTMKAADGKIFSWTAQRAPLLKRNNPPVWGKPVKLFNGKNLDGWHASGKNQWKAEDGILRSSQSGSNLMTDKTFTDFKLHIEFRYPKGSNSGVYLRGRYEVQVEDSKGKEPQKDLLGAIYGFIAPNEMVAKAAGEWQSFDITLVGRLVTVVANGKKIICNQVIPGITGGAINSREGEPGPILIQGDHGPVDYRNIVITTAK